MEAVQPQQPQQQETRISREEFIQIQKMNSLSNQVSSQSLRIADLESQLALANVEMSNQNKMLEDLKAENEKLKASAEKLIGEDPLDQEEASSNIN